MDCSLHLVDHVFIYPILSGRLPMHLLPGAFTEALRLSVSVKRINSFLNAGDLGDIPIYKDYKKKSKRRSDREEDDDEEYDVEVRLLMMI